MADKDYSKEVPESRVEKDLMDLGYGTNYDTPAMSRVEYLLKNLKISGGGGSGVPGADGHTYEPKIGTVTVEDDTHPVSASVVLDKVNYTATYSFILPKGKDGRDGVDGQDGQDGAPGKDGTPGKDGKDGRSITAIKTDENGNIIVTFDDESTENLGQLKVDVQADFLTANGFGNLRYYLGKFQYFNTAQNDWVDATVDPQNPYILQMIPQEMQYIVAVYNKEKNKIKLKWLEPKDTNIEGQAAVIVEKVIIRRKLSSAPENSTDGDLVMMVKRSEFGSHQNEWWIDDGVEPEDGQVYYYKMFPVATTGFINESEKNQIKVEIRNYVLYGFKIDQTESDPAHMITYLPDCDNANFASAHMDYNAGIFNYGDWTVDAGAWFMGVKPCLLNRNGTVSKYLDPDDYAKDIDGTDVTDEITNGPNGENVMIEVPKVYWKIVPSDDGNIANIYISNVNLKHEDGNVTKAENGNFVCWSHIDENGDEIPYCYMPAYNGSNENNVLRSLTNKTPINTKTAQDEIDYAKANNKDDSNIWYTEVYCDRVLINLLLLLIGKSTDTQTVFGQGYHTGGTITSNPRMTTGTMNDKGLFYGTNAGIWGDGKTNGVKVFGMEHYWGNQWRRIAGRILDQATQKVKMTYEYNTIGDGYIEIQGSTPTSTSGGYGYVSKCLFTENGIIPVTANGTQMTYYTDGLWFNTKQNNYALVGGSSVDGLLVGALSENLQDATSSMYWSIGAAISRKPLASTFQS